uniref:Uncharacterized protein n=1 Tax=Alexandrium catenella TaxID=2925 RepID=A0A7S1S691_ALECA
MVALGGAGAEGQSAPAEGSLQAFLQDARPDWKPKDVKRAEEKLEKVGILTLDGLVGALLSKADQNLNARLKETGEKSFTSDTLMAFRRRAKEYLRAVARPSSRSPARSLKSVQSAPPSTPRRLAPSSAGSRATTPTKDSVSEEGNGTVLSLSDLTQVAKDDLLLRCEKRGIPTAGSMSRGMLALLLKADARRQHLQRLQAAAAAV